MNIKKGERVEYVKKKLQTLSDHTATTAASAVAVSASDLDESFEIF
jgi:hypothetical protein